MDGSLPLSLPLVSLPLSLLPLSLPFVPLHLLRSPVLLILESLRYEMVDSILIIKTRNGIFIDCVLPHQQGQAPLLPYPSVSCRAPPLPGSKFKAKSAQLWQQMRIVIGIPVRLLEFSYILRLHLSAYVVNGRPLSVCSSVPIALW